MKKLPFIWVTVFGFLLSSCSVGPEPIAFDKDDCDHCKMTISDNRYGAELVSKKGRVYKFDDLYCMKAFLEDGIISDENIHSLWTVDFAETEKLLDVNNSFFLFNDQLKSPMGSNTVAFSTKEQLEKYHSEFSGTALTWKEFLELK